VLLAIVAVQLNGSADADSLLSAGDARAGKGKTGDFLNSLKALGMGGKQTELFDTSPEDLDGMSRKQKSKIHQQEQAAHMKALQVQASASATTDASAKPHKPSLAEIKLDRAAAQEGDKLLAEDSKVASEELMSPEHVVKKLLTKDRQAVTARDVAFQAHLKKMAATDKAQETRDTAREAAKEKKVGTFVV